MVWINRFAAYRRKKNIQQMSIKAVNLDLD